MRTGRPGKRFAWPLPLVVDTVRDRQRRDNRGYLHLAVPRRGDNTLLDSSPTSLRDVGHPYLAALRELATRGDMTWRSVVFGL
jgi:hypothetical protein